MHHYKHIECECKSKKNQIGKGVTCQLSKTYFIIFVKNLILCLKTFLLLRISFYGFYTLLNLILQIKVFEPNSYALPIIMHTHFKLIVEDYLKCWSIKSAQLTDDPLNTLE